MTAAAIVQALGGRWHGRYGMCRCICHDDGATPALKISDDPRKSDGVDVVCFAGCDWRDIKAELVKRGLLLNGQTRPIVQYSPLQAVRVQLDHPNRAAAAAMWQAAQPIRGTLAERYLNGRGISIIPPTLRYVAAARHKSNALVFPCMLAAVTVWPSKSVHAVHRTYLSADGRSKAPVGENKMMLGPCAGGAVRLAPVAAELAVAEGIETALSAMLATDIPTWAPMSTSGMRTVLLPREARSIVILADNDTNGAGQEAADALADRLKREGRAVRIVRPTIGKDFNDSLLAGAA